MNALRSRSTLLVAGLAATVAAVHWRVLLGGETWVLRDLLGFGVPSREYLARSLRSGRLPEWADWMGLGGPFAANPIHSVTYPPAWIVALLPMPFGADALILLHLALAAVGAALLARRLGASTLGAFLAGAVLATSGYVVSVVPNGMAPILAWTPWVGWAADRLACAGDGLPRSEARRARLRAGATLAAIFAAQVVQAEPLSVAAAAALTVALTLARADRPLPALARLAMAGAAAAPLAAATLVPGLAMLRSSDRAAGLSDRVGLAWSLHPLRNLEWIWPGILGDRGDPRGDLAWRIADASLGAATEASWSTSLFLGLPVLLLAAFAARRIRAARWLAAFGVGFLVLALGGFTPAYPALRAIAPLLAAGRYPEKLVIGMVVLAAALAGVGFTAAIEQGGRRGERLAASAGAVLLAAAAGGLWILARALPAPPPGPAGLPPFDPVRWLERAIPGGAVAAASAAAFAAALAARERPRLARFAPAIAAMAIVAPLAWSAGAVNRTAPRRIAADLPPLLAPVADAPFREGMVRPRVYVTPWIGVDLDREGASLAGSFRDSIPGNALGRHGFAVLPGADSARSPAAAALLEVERFVPPERLGGMLGARHLVVEWARMGGSKVLRVDPVARVALLELPESGVRPHAFVAAAWRWAAAQEALRDVVASGGERPQDRTWVTLLGQGEDGGEPGPLRACDVAEESPERVDLACSSPAGGYAVLLDEMAPGWTARVDGQPAAIETADALFRAVRVGPGTHRIRFSYATPGLRAGAAIAAASWLALLVLLATTSRRRALTGTTPEPPVRDR